MYRLVEFDIMSNDIYNICLSILYTNIIPIKHDSFDINTEACANINPKLTSSNRYSFITGRAQAPSPELGRIESVLVNDAHVSWRW